MPLQASQNLISWSYDPVTKMTDMSWRADWFFEDAEAEGIIGSKGKPRQEGLGMNYIKELQVRKRTPSQWCVNAGFMVLQ